MPFARVRDLQMYYEMRGAGPRLLGINGTGADLRRPPTFFDAPLAGCFTILAFDQRGLGQTSRPDMPYSMADYAADADALLEVVGWERCLVMGISFGGMVAQEFALRYPQRVERLVLACASSGGAGGAPFPLHEIADLPTEEYARRLIAASDTRQDVAWQAAHPEQVQEMIAQTVAGLRFAADEPGHAMGARRQLLARAQHDAYDRLPQLHMPVYVCGGLYDGITPPANLRALAGQISGARLELFEGGHGFLAQDPRAWERVIAFLLGRDL